MSLALKAAPRRAHILNPKYITSNKYYSSPLQRDWTSNVRANSARLLDKRFVGNETCNQSAFKFTQ
jgi:hypothetical protein